MLVLIIPFGTYLVFRWTNFLLKESEEPFRYTFWIEPFNQVEGTPDKRFTINGIDRFHLLHHDLKERINQRIRRFSLLDVTKVEKEALTSHIQIRGHYAIREEEQGKWLIHVMPRVRIGPLGRPETLANPVKYPLTPSEKRKNNDANSKAENSKLEGELDAERYNQIVERVYSSIATEIYRQIESDVKEKINLFPTDYMKALALFHEAEDFARSNTIDAYDRAIKLYEHARRYFDITDINGLTDAKLVHLQAKIRIGYAKSLIYKRLISAFSGRYKNPLFEIPHELNEVIQNLTNLHDRINPARKLEPYKENDKQKRLNILMTFLTFPKYSWPVYKPARSLFEEQRRLLFDANVVNALAHYYLGAVQKAKKYLDYAKAVDPTRSETNALYLFACGEIEPNLDKEIPLFRQATEISPDFQVAQSLLAHSFSMRFRSDNEIVKERAESVIKEYDEVLRINPGNITALAAQGYIYLLLKDFKKAKKKFEEGREIKAIARETFIGELNYGLARIDAEEGRLNDSYDLYMQAISSDPGVAAYSVTASRLVTTPYYDYIGSEVLERYKRFKEKVEKFVKPDTEDKEVSQRTVNVIYSFVLNDYGNACLNYFHRHGYKHRDKLEKAIEAFEKAIEKDRYNKAAYYNLQNAYVWRDKEGDRPKAIKRLVEIDELGPTWPVAVIALVQSHLRYGTEEIKNKVKEKQNVGEEIKKLENQKKRLEEEEKKSGIHLVTQREIKDIAIKISPLGKERQPEDIETQQKVKDIQPEDKALQFRISRQDITINDLKKKENDLNKEIADLRKNHEKNVLNAGNKIIERTKLSSVYEGLEFDLNGNGVDKFLSERIERDKLDENDIEALRVWAEVLSNSDQDERALSAAEKLSKYILNEYYPDNFDVNLILREMDLRKYFSYPEQLKNDKRKKEILDPDKEIKECGRNYEEKLKPIIENWLKQDPDNHLYENFLGNTYNDIGNKYYEIGDYEEAISYYKEAIENSNKVAVYHTNLGGSFRALNKWDEAEKAYLEAINLEPNNAVYYSNLGLAYGNLAYSNPVKWDDAITAHSKAKELEPDNAVYWNDLGNAFYGKKEYEKSIDYYAKAIEKDPKVAVYHTNLGGSFRALNKWDEAEKAYLKAIELEPNNPEHHNGLGNIFYGKGDYKRAAEEYLRAIAINPEVQVYTSNLILACDQLKDSDKPKPISFLESALKYKPDNAELIQAIERLKTERE